MSGQNMECLSILPMEMALTPLVPIISTTLPIKTSEFQQGIRVSKYFLTAMRWSSLVQILGYVNEHLHPAENG